MQLFLAHIFGALAITMAQAPSGMENPSSTAGYRFRYFVRDDRTGDVKGQTEVREGDNVRGSYALAEPNGDMRIVTYTAGKDTGFKARVQIHQKNPPLPPLPSTQQQLTNNPGLDYLMRIPPRNVQRSGFQHVEIKVVPPSTTAAPQVTQKPPFVPEEEELLTGQSLPNHGHSNQNYELYNKQSDGTQFVTAQELPNHGYSEQNYEVFNSATDRTVLNDHNTGGSNNTVLSSTTKPNIPCPTSCDEAGEGRARIKQEGDQAQLEMEQVIRTEMKDPENVNMGRPYQSNQHVLRLDGRGGYQNQQHSPRPEATGDPHQYPHNPQPESGFPYPTTPFGLDMMTPVYMKPLYMKTNSGPFTGASYWPPIVTLGDRLYMPHIVDEKEDVPPEIFPTKVYLVPIPRPFAFAHEDSRAHSWDGRTPVPKEDQSVPYQSNRPRPQQSFSYPPTLTYLLFPKDSRGK